MWCPCISILLQPALPAGLRLIGKNNVLQSDRHTKVFYALTKFNTKILYSQNMIVRLVTFG